MKMIESIDIIDTATFGPIPEKLTRLSKFNYLFGSNGTGKTTVSRVIADENKFPTCRVTWRRGTVLQAMVYNQDFVERNFHSLTEFKGVFTLGEKQADTLAKIASAKAELALLTTEVESLTQTLQGATGTGGKRGELSALEVVIKEACWAKKQEHDAKLQGAFEGYRGSSEKFKSKVLQEAVSNTAELFTLTELENKAQSIFGPTPITEAVVATIDASVLIALEENPILKKRVIGKGDVDIAAMIHRLGNSDWVRAGRVFYETNENTCPFCQQSTTENFTRSLNEYFDEAFVIDSRAIENLIVNYGTEAARIQQGLAAIIAAPSRFIDVEKLKSEKELLDTKISLNIQRLAAKKKEASQVIELESLSNVFSAITSLIEMANGQVVKHNSMVENIVAEKATLTNQVWRFVVEELNVNLAAHKASKADLNKAIEAITKRIDAKTEDKRLKAAEIRELEKQTTSIMPTCDEINALLSSFGFRGFKLAITESGTAYKLVRLDGTDAKATLSEGEKTFVTFLYFYHLLKGSESDTGMTTDRIVVIDDPVSSLDSDILFIVGSLIKGLIEDVRSDTGYIKQIFVLTHNVYFHKEVTFNPNRRAEAMTEETFWVVRKADLISKIEGHKSNPIKTSYELLWAEVRRSDRSNHTIQNTLRRILENYFRILGGVNPDDICARFSGKEKLICKSLFSWVNDGSHYAHDDLYVSIDDSMVEAYLSVFREIFKKSNHLAHYAMMMGDSFVEEPEATLTDEVTSEALKIRQMDASTEMAKPGFVKTDKVLARAVSGSVAKSLRIGTKVRKLPLVFTATLRSGKLRQQNRNR